jgi:hypothetical protein
MNTEYALPSWDGLRLMKNKVILDVRFECPPHALSPNAIHRNQCMLGGGGYRPTTRPIPLTTKDCHIYISNSDFIDPLAL